MARPLGFEPLPSASQNLKDFSDANRKVLNMMEWWLRLVMPEEEVEQEAIDFLQQRL